MGSHTPLIYLVAGEPSGDLIGASLMHALKEEAKGNIRFSGIGGPLMEAEGLQSIFPMKELSIMGIVEIIPHIPNVLARLAQTIRHIQQMQPDVIVTLDSPGFNFRLAKKLRTLDSFSTPLIHYTAPTVWAWRPWRAKKIARLYDHLLTLFSFEPPYFEKYGLSTSFVGHPLIEKRIHEISPSTFRQKYAIAPDTPLLCLLPGSRQGEIKRLSPIFCETLRQLKSRLPSLQAVLPTLPHLKEQMLHTFADCCSDLLIVTQEQEKYEAMRASNTALAASGTVTLELALAQCPMVVAYKINKITEYILRPLLLTSHVALPNIIAGKLIVPECLQESCDAQNLTTHLHALLTQPKLQHTQQDQLGTIRPNLQYDQTSPSKLAAEIIFSYVLKK